MNAIAVPGSARLAGMRATLVPANTRNWAGNSLRTAILCSLFSVIFLQEYFQASAGPIASILYDKIAGAFRTIDLILIVIVVPHLAAIACSRTRIVYFPRSVMLPAFGFLGSLAFAVVCGIWRGASNLFFDWRALALGFGLYFVWIFWIQTVADVESAVRLFLFCVAVRVATLYWQYIGGNGEVLQGVRIPIYDGPTISALVFAALLALSYRQCPAKKVVDLWLLSLTTATSLMVILCFRRTFWAALIVGAMVLLLLSERRNKIGVVAKFATIVGLAAVMVGAPFYARLRSFNLFQTSAEFSEDNGDHVDDLLDAWDQVRQSPVLGVGLGTPYPTWRIRNWKSESVMVHNAVIHVWLKYGLCGLTFYLWFHLALFRWMKGRANLGSPKQSAFLLAVLAYLIAQFVVSLTFAPWPFSELQSTTLISFLLAGASVPATLSTSGLRK